MRYGAGLIVGVGLEDLSDRTLAGIGIVVALSQNFDLTSGFYVVAFEIEAVSGAVLVADAGDLDKDFAVASFGGVDCESCQLADSFGGIGVAKSVEQLVDARSLDDHTSARFFCGRHKATPF